MAPVVTVTRTLSVPGLASFDGIFYSDRQPRRSAIFAAGGYDWSISIHYSLNNFWDVENIYFFLVLQSTLCSGVTASLDVAFLDPTGSLPPLKTHPTPPVELNDYNRVIDLFLPKIYLQSMATDPRYLTRGGLLIEFTITVIPETPAPAPPPTTEALPSRAKAPASDMMEQLGEIYATKEGADVTYSVQGELFPAHKIILAMRSPVFKAQLFGGMMESRAQLIEIEDMVPDVFRALLRYIYTDALPATDGDQVGEGEDAIQQISHLLVAADRYGVERLKILCEQKLCNLVDADSLVKMLVFADELHCEMLRDACIEFMATSDRMGTVVASEEYAQLRSTHPLVLIYALEKSNKDFGRDSDLNIAFGGMTL